MLTKTITELWWEGSAMFLVAALAILLSSFYLLQAWFSSRGLPPGPWGLPVVGYLPWLNPKAPHLTLSQLVKCYGKVLSVRLGSVNTVVLADPQLVRESLSLKSTTGRAPLFLTHGIMKGYGLICSEGDMWREHRKFVLGFMRDHGMRTVASRAIMEEKIHTVAQHLTQELEEKKEAVVVKELLLHNVGNTMNELVFGVTYKDDDPVWRWLRHLLHEGTKLVGVAGPLNFLPWLRFLPSFREVIRFITENQAKTHEEYQKIIIAHERSISSPTTMANGNDEEKRDQSQNGKENTEEKSVDKADRGRQQSSPVHIIDAYVKERMVRGEAVGSFTYEQLHHVAADLFGAGSETTITTLEWHFLNMAVYPDVQRKVQSEIVRVADGRDHVTLDEAPLLPYTNAAILESQRLRSILPLGIPHGVSEDMTIGGYRIPRGTMLLPLQWYIHRDPDTWIQPEDYLPERFLDEENNIIRHPSFMPFQTGRRMCIGDEFAKMILFIFTTRIFLHFTLSLEDNLKEDPTKDPVCGISLTPRPFKLKFTSRN